MSSELLLGATAPIVMVVAKLSRVGYSPAQLVERIIGTFDEGDPGDALEGVLGEEGRMLEQGEVLEEPSETKEEGKTFEGSIQDARGSLEGTKAEMGERLEGSEGDTRATFGRGALVMLEGVGEEVGEALEGAEEEAEEMFEVQSEGEEELLGAELCDGAGEAARGSWRPLDTTERFLRLTWELPFEGKVAGAGRKGGTTRPEHDISSATDVERS